MYFAVKIPSIICESIKHWLYFWVVHVLSLQTLPLEVAGEILVQARIHWFICTSRHHNQCVVMPPNKTDNWSHPLPQSLLCLSYASSDSLEPTYQQLQKMKLDKSPFVVVSVIGQELLTHSFHGASVVVLEAGLKIGTCSLKLRGSVFSALSSAYWSLGNAEKSMAYMQQDLEVTKTLGEEEEEEKATVLCKRAARKWNHSN